MLHHKLATTEDSLEKIRDFCMEALKETPHAHMADPERITPFVYSFMLDGIDKVLFLMLDDEEIVGVIFGVVTQNVLYPQIATEVFWFVKPEHRGKAAIEFFKLYDNWAMLSPYSTVSYFHGGQDLSRTYERFGYKPLEINLVRKNS